MTERDSIEERRSKTGGDNEKSEKKGKKSKRKRDDRSEVVEVVENGDIEAKQDELKTTGSKSKELLKQRRSERQKLLEQVPKSDENGISYTKQQIRFMRKRVQKGLNPIETPAEKHKRLVTEAEIRKEVEAELAGFNDTTDDVTKNDEDDDDNDDDDHRVIANNSYKTSKESPIGATKFDSDGDVVSPDEENYSYEKSTQDILGEPMERRPIKKKKREKPVPSDYICSACKGTNNDQPPHWIYDCLYKKTMPGTNQVSRKQRGLHDPLETKLFVSGLPFDSTIKDVTELFTTASSKATNDLVPPVVHCKLIKFEDTKRCKGQAFVTFATPEAAKVALKLNGTTIKSSTTNNKSKTTGKKNEIKELKLKITKVLNRTLTKK